MRFARSTRWMLLVAATLLTIASGQLSSVVRQPPQQYSSPQQQQQAARQQKYSGNINLVSDSVTNLAQRIARAISNQKSKTEIFSPVSIAGALSLLLLGSGGQTQKELLKVMGLDSGALSFQDIHLGFGRLFQDLVSNEPSLEPLVTWRQNDKCNRFDEEEEDEDYPLPPAANSANELPSHRISLANGIFLQNGLQPAYSYANLTSYIYQSVVTNLDFERDPNGAAQAMNGWISDATNGKIREVVNEGMLRGARLVVASALYFKAKWETQFLPIVTRSRPFYPNGQLEPAFVVDTMSTSACFPYYNASREYALEIIGLPYETAKSTMYIILPDNSNRARVQEVLAGFSAEQLNWLIDRMTQKKGMVMLPKMAISNRIGLNGALRQLGIHDLFHPGLSNLSSILDDSSIIKRFGNTQPRPPTQPSVPQPRPPQRPQGQPVQPQVPQPQRPPQENQLQQSLTFSWWTEQECALAENCQPGPNSQCFCTYQPSPDESSGACGAKMVALYSDNTQKQCPISVRLGLGTTYICAKRGYELVEQFRNQSAACEARAGCRSLWSQCFCCRQSSVPPQAQTQAPTVQRPQPSTASGSAPLASRFGPESTATVLRCAHIPLYNDDVGCISRGYRWIAQQRICIDPSTCRRLQKRQISPQQQQEPQQYQPQQQQPQQQHPRQQQPFVRQEAQSPQRQQQQFVPQQSQSPQRPVQQQQFVPQQSQSPQRPVQQQSQQPQQPPPLAQPQPQPNLPLYVDQVIHQVTLDVNEQGTEGGAVTLGLIDRIGPAFVFHVDRPFILLVRHDATKLPLFYGAVYDPRG